MALTLLGEDEVHIWYACPGRAGSAETLERCRALLSAEELAKQARFVRPIDGQLYLVAHALLRLTLSRYLDVAPEGLRFAANEFGRPEIAGTQGSRGLQFNLSHTHGLVACGVAWNRPIGVDVENIHRGGDGAGLMSVAARYFSPQELAELQSRPCQEQPARFIDYWTLKEAYLKARGVGLSLGLDKFSMQIGAGQPVSISFAPGFNDDPRQWQFAQFRPTAEHAAAVAVQAPRRQETRFLWREFQDDDAAIGPLTPPSGHLQ